MKRLLTTLSGAMLLMAVGMLLFEVIKSSWFPNTSLWESHFLTIGFSTVIVGLAAFFVFRAGENRDRRLACEVVERKRAEEELRKLNAELEQRVSERTVELEMRKLELEDFLENATEGLHWVDDDGQIIWANQAELNLLGYTRKEYVGHSIVEFHVDREIINDILKRLLQGEALYNYEARLRCKDGAIKYVLINSNTLMQNGRFKHTRCFTRDITERKRVDEEIQKLNQALEQRVRERTAELQIINDELQKEIVEHKRADESLKLFRTLIDRSNDAIEVLDPQTGRFWDANEKAYTDLGYTREEFLSLKVPDIDPNFNEAAFLKKMGELRKIGLATLESLHRRKDGSTFPVEINLKYVQLNRAYLVAVVRDITERKRAEERVRQQARLLDLAHDAIIVRDLQDRVLYWNQGAGNIYGWTAEEAVGKKASDLLPVDAIAYEAAKKVVQEKGGWKGEATVRTKDGQEVLVEADWTLVRDDQGIPQSIMVISSDITEKRKLEVQTLRSQRMESVGTLAGGIAHDLNNVLTPLLISVQLLKRKLTDADGQKLLATLEANVQRGAKLVKQVLAFGRGVKGDRIQVEPESIVREIGQIIHETFPKSLEFETRSIPDLWTVIGDATQLHQVLLNLCVNARDAMPDGGKLTIKLENTVLDELYAGINLEARPGPYVTIHVADTGTGIPKEVQDKMFEPFFTTKEIGKGTGLGLSTCFSIIKSHGGFINCYSEPGKGSIFKVYLPANTNSAAAENPASQQTQLPHGNNELVLVVDDEKAILDIAQKVLEHFGYRVLTAGHGAEAIALYRQHQKEIDVVLTDMMMPVMDGPTAIIALKAINPRVKIIGASGLDSTAGMAKATDAGNVHFIPKPYTGEIILHTLHKVLHPNHSK